MVKTPAVIDEMFRAIEANGGSSFFVGGCVRDPLRLANIGAPKDFDIEVFGLSVEQLRNILATTCYLRGLDDTNVLSAIAYTEAGKSFGVFKVTVGGIDFDFSVPRRDNNTGIGHKDFEISHDPNMWIDEAALRRDFTMNAIYQDARTGLLVDPYGGINDLCEEKILRVVNSATFVQDPLRALRAFRFLSQFGELTASDELIDLCSRMVDSCKSLPKERIWGEWVKWSLSAHPEKGIQFLYDTSLINLYKEIGALIGIQQDKDHHPEGDAFVHTCHVLGNVHSAHLDRSLACFAALCHDFGKATTTLMDEDGKITAYGHQDAGVAPTTSFLESIGAPKGLIERVIPLVKEHMVCAELGSVEVTPRIVRRLANRLAPATISDLSVLVEADISGRPPKPVGQHRKMIDILRVSLELGVTHDTLKPIIMGRHLIEFGMEPDPVFKKILSACFEAQLDGVFSNFEEGRIFLRGYLGGLHDQ